LSSLLTARGNFFSSQLASFHPLFKFTPKRSDMDLIKYETGERLAWITLNRPEKRNALSYELVAELKEAFQKAAYDPKVKVIILRAEGTSFCAGADIAYLQQLQSNTYEENLEDSTHLKELFEMIYTIPKVVIAQVQGSAIAGGCGLATVCDMVYAVPEAQFGYTEVKIGFIPAIVMVFLVRKLGDAKARELLLTGQLIDAKKAYELGIVNEVVAPDLLAGRVEEMAARLIVNNSEQSMGMTKQMMAEVQQMSIVDALQYAAEQNAVARSTNDCKRGMAAFLNKEKISW
jgi:methylglutaconyl-CoA hydratase